MEDFVRKQGGKRPISRVLIACNGCAAVKKIRSVRKWAYETFADDRAIHFTVMATPEDIAANTEFIRLADQYVQVPGGSNNHNYANVDLIVDVAERAAVHAVWAGWGHASENPRLPDLLEQTNIAFIGPNGDAMRTLGDKISSTIVAQSAQVPTMSWSGDGLVLKHPSVPLRSVPAEMYERACVHSAQQGLEEARRIGFPVMVKCSSTGGGRGIRKVMIESEFQHAYEECCQEAPGSPVFLMKLASNARHLEVQVLADEYGNVISLFGRDCSVQRRHQKIIEEAPVSIANSDTFEQMEQAAVRLAKLVGYVSAGTVECLYEPDTGKYYFLELNPRLQVEHPCTEIVSGVNLPVAQLLVACGISLNRMKDIRILYGLAPHGDSEVDFNFEKPVSHLVQRRPMPKGHVIAARITAENPDAGFKPSGGKMLELNFRSSTNVWGYFSVGAAGGLHEYADSQFGHIFAYGENRSQARRNMIMALKELSIRGDFRTTVEYLIKLLEAEEFKNNSFDTAWLDSLIQQNLTASRPDRFVTVICGAVTQAYENFAMNTAQYVSSLERGQVAPSSLLRTSLKLDVFHENAKYNFAVMRCSHELFALYLNGPSVQVHCRRLNDGGFLILLGNQTYAVYSKEEAGGTRLTINGQTTLLERENDPTQLRSPSSGKLLRFLVSEGAPMAKNMAYAEIEVMKTVMPLITSESGTIHLLRQPGSAIEADEVLAVLSLDNPGTVKRAIVFDGTLPAVGPPFLPGDKPYQVLDAVLGSINSLFCGYEQDLPIEDLVETLLKTLRNPILPFSQFRAKFSNLQDRLPETLCDSILNLVKNEHVEFPARELKRLMNEYPVEEEKLGPLHSVVDAYLEGIVVNERRHLVAFLERFYVIQVLFDDVGEYQHQKRATEHGSTLEGVILKLRETHQDDLLEVVDLVRCRSKVANQVAFIERLLQAIKMDIEQSRVQLQFYAPILRKLTQMNSSKVVDLTLSAREILIIHHLPSVSERVQQTGKALASAVSICDPTSISKFGPPNVDALTDLVHSEFTIHDVLVPLFYDNNRWIGLAAIEVYVRRAYSAYRVISVSHHAKSTPYVLEWEYMLNDVTSVPSSPTKLRSDLNFDQSIFRRGLMVAYGSIVEISTNMESLLKVLPMDSEAAARINCVNIALKTDSVEADDLFSQELLRIAIQHQTDLAKHGVRRLSFIVLVSNSTYPKLFTFRVRESHSSIEYREDRSVRHVEPAKAYRLEVSRLSNFDITPVLNLDKQQLCNLYYAVGKQNPSDCRFFVRVLVRAHELRGRDEQEDIRPETIDYLTSLGDRVIGESLDALELAMAEKSNADCNHLFINFTPTFDRVQAQDVVGSIQGFIQRHGDRFWKLRLTSGEVRLKVRPDENTPATRMRFFLNNVSGYVLKVESYREDFDAESRQYILRSARPNPGSFENYPVDFVYENKELLQPKRYKAHLMGTTYVYDFPELFKQAIQNLWATSSTKSPLSVFELHELVTDGNGKLVKRKRSAGLNKIGMVGWWMTLRTPEYPGGRDIIVVANDITHQIGSFGVDEDLFFKKCSEMARSYGIPRVYICANSGARIGLAEELLDLYKVSWCNKQNVDYLYLDEDGLSILTERAAAQGKKVADSVILERAVINSEVRYRILDIVGLKQGLGVENLQGSGLIAGETSQAYREIFTITLVTCRSVGIGAYLVRLGQRTIQINGHPIILTGAAALNKVLGRNVYTSNLQLGGTQIMYNNGVTHKTAGDDLEGVTQILEWLSFVPRCRDAGLPIIPSVDLVDRDVKVLPDQGNDVRDLLQGALDPNGNWVAGLFDRDSFVETLGGWSKTIVTGRCRLGGIPLGVIAIEARTIEYVIPADPADDLSREQVLSQAGQVWFPNGAFKTAQGINDFNYGEQLPLFILANWRGFSGGMMDMFNEILKYGSMIVDALRDYRQPVIVYIPPKGELRGGAWVVLDSSINAEMMEMYVDPTARGGVLEPEGIVEIKYRKPQLLKLMERLDGRYAAIKKAIQHCDNVDQLDELQHQLKRREDELMPVYHQVALQFADLHDTPGRMQAKRAIHGIVEWKDSRRFFYWRLRSRLIDEQIRRDIQEFNMNVTLSDIRSIIKDSGYDGPSDEAFVHWFETEGKNHVANCIKSMRDQVLTKKIKDILKQNPQLVGDISKYVSAATASKEE